ncbi:MAG: XisI protein [Blastocatellia bacterium]
MDKLTKYRQILKNVLNEYVALDNRNPDPDIESFLVIDEKNDNYIWMNIGWKDNRRTSASTVYVRIRDGKIWIEEDWTEDGIATDLLDAGVPNDDIVLAFQPPDMRQYTEFAAA